MRQAILKSAECSELVETAQPSCGESDVLVKVEACGVCTSELPQWRDGNEVPAKLGHEVVGIVEHVGERVVGFASGQRVTGLFEEGFAEYAAAPAERVLTLPDNLRTSPALGEPLACAVSAARRTQVELGDHVVIIGLGYMGLLMIQLLRLEGAAYVVGVDLREDALAFAKTLGADETFHLDKVPAQLTHLSKGYSADIVVEATGTQAGLTLAGSMVKPHGVLSILGYHQNGPRNVDMQLWNHKALNVLNAHERREDYRMDCMKRGLALASAHRLELAPLITHTYELAQVDEAFRAASTKPEGFIKAVIIP